MPADVVEELARRLHLQVANVPAERAAAIFHLLSQSKASRGSLTDRELRWEIIDFLSRLDTAPKNVGPQVAAFLESLARLRKCNAILFHPNLSNLPIGLRLGNVQIVNQPESPDEIADHVRQLAKAGRVAGPTRGWASVAFDAHRSHGLAELLRQVLDLPFGILAAALDVDFSTVDLCGGIMSAEGECELLTPSSPLRATTVTVLPQQVRFLEKAGETLFGAKLTPLQTKLSNSLRIFLLSRQSTLAEIRFVLCTSAIESLLLSKADRDYIGEKLAEKAAFLLETDGGRRKLVYKAMKKFYGKRSELVHGSGSAITDADDVALTRLFQALVQKIISLCADFARMERQSGSEGSGIEDMLDSLKFGT